MRSAYRITPRLAVALTIAGVTLIGLVVRSTLAQDGPKASPPATPAESPSPSPDPGVLIPPAAALNLTAPSEPPLPPADQAKVDSAVPSPAAPETDDPEKNARAFIERNRKEAQDELKKLKDEAERLRTRLGKVEAGIRRWESLLGAIENSEKTGPTTVVPTTTSVPSSDHPTQLEPIPGPRRATVIRESAPANPPAPSSR